MLFAKTLVVLCAATVAMAGSCLQEKFDSMWGRGERRGRMNVEMNELRCKCNSSMDEMLTKISCAKIGKQMTFCYAQGELVCETQNKADEFRKDCAAHAANCVTVEC
ncbi:hypothetical protein BGZ94_007500 [Podila epigama]|nr:hypothetical protein BGZ94_007500 [Podila epigama]